MADEVCENCQQDDADMRYDVEGVPICNKCWNDPDLWDE